MNDQSRDESAPSLGVLSRLYRMTIGSIMIISIAIAVMMKSFEKNLIINLAYWSLVLSIILIRYLDIRYFKGETADGEPATMKHWKRFCMAIGILLILLQTIAQWFKDLAKARGREIN